MITRRKPLTHAQWNSIAPLAGGAIALLFILAVGQQSPSVASLPWPILALWVVLYSASRLLAITLREGTFSFARIFLVAAFFVFGLPIAIWIGLYGILADQIIRVLLRGRFGFEARSPGTVIRDIGASLVRVTFSLGFGALAFQAVGGITPLSHLTTADTLPILALFAAYSLAALAIHLALALPKTPSALHNLTRTTSAPVALLKLAVLPLPLSLITAIIALNSDWTVFSVFAVFQIALMVLIRVLGTAQAKLEKRVRELASVSAVGQAVISSLDLPEMLEAIHKHVSPLMDARDFYVALYNEDYDELTFPLAYEDGQPTRYRSRDMSNGLTEYVLRMRTPLLISSDVPAVIQRLGLDAMSDQHVQCWLGVPITIGDRVLGVIAVQSHTQPGIYTQEDVELLNTIASQAAVAIENAQLYASTRRRASELAILNSVSTVVGSSLDLNQVMDAIVSSVGPVVGCQKAAIFLIQEGGRSLSLAVSRGLSQTYLDQLPAMMRTARSEGSASGVERQPLIVNDVRLDPRFEMFRAAAEREGLRAFADVPLQARDQVIGTLGVYYTEPHLFTVAELDLLTTFANQAAVAVSNATLYAQTDQALTRRITELSAIEEIGRELTSTLDFNHVIQRVLEAALQSTHATQGLVALYEPDHHMLTLVAEHGYAPDALSNTAIQHWLAGQGVAGEAIRDRRTIWVDDVQEPGKYVVLDPSVKSVLAAPILRDGQPLGVVNLDSTRRAAFNDELAHFVSQLTTQAAIAIRNAQLYQQARNRLREMSVLFDMSRQFTAILDLTELGRELTRQMATALGTTHCMIELLARNSDKLEATADHAAPGLRSIVLPHNPAGVLRQLDIDGLRYSRQPVTIYIDALRGTDPEYEFLRAQDVYALIGLPLVASNEIIGRIVWMHAQARIPFSVEEIRFAQTLANQAGIALENARLFSERARRINDLSQLYQASLALASSIEVNETLDRIAVIAREITGSDAVTLYLYDPQTDRITHGSYLAGSKDLIDVSTIRPHGITRRVIETRRPVIIQDTVTDPDVNPRVLEAGIRALIGMPILRKSEVLGVLYVNSREPGKYSDDSLQLIQLLANEAAVALENTRLFGEIAQARDRLAAILNSSRDAVLMFDVSGRVIVANPMIEQVWDIPRTRLEGRLLGDLIDAPEINLAARLGYSPQMLHALLKQTASGALVTWSKEVFSLAGPRSRTIERTGQPVLDERGGLVGWMLVLRDVTEEHELQRLREDLSSMIIHDLRSPLVAILDSYELMNEDLSPQAITSVGRQALEVGQRSTRKLLNLVNSLLDISRFEYGQVPLDTQFAALHALIENAIEQISPLSLEQSVIIRNQIPIDLPLVKVDEDQITRVLINLIDNAVKFSPYGGQVMVSARALAGEAGADPRFVVCSVRDSGPGIPPEHRQRVFDRFTQLSDGPIRRRGTGLGLAFCKLAIEAHGGSIWVDNPPENKGSQFSFRLPIAILPSDEEL